VEEKERFNEEKEQNVEEKERGNPLGLTVVWYV
jgi:hypothetical protein